MSGDVDLKESSSPDDVIPSRVSCASNTIRCLQLQVNCHTVADSSFRPDSR